MNLILTILLAFGFIALFYRLVIRRLFADVISQRIEAQEEALERLVENGEERRDDFCYLFLSEQFKIRRILREVSVSSFFHFLVKNKDTETDFSDVKRFLTESSPQLRRMYSEHGKDFALWMAINSPVYCFVFFLVIATLVLLRAVDAQLIKLQAATFVETEVRLRA